jgi:hypothetical protein
MTINDFFNSLEKYLNDFQYPPNKSYNEGLIYIGINENYSDFTDEDEKIYFVNYLCMIVALDLKFYELNKENYLKFKNSYNIPKFEYGLSNIYYFPNAIYYKFNVLNNNNILKDCFDNFFNYYSKSVNNNDLGITFEVVLESMIQDNDIKSGIWGNEFCKLILQKLEN